MVLYKQLSIKTNARSHWVDITKMVNQFLQEKGVITGICHISSLHTTGAITINENADPDVERDFFYMLQKLVPQAKEFVHSEGNSDSHIKTSLVGLSVQISVVNSKLVLGTWQSVYFCEFDGPRNRHISLMYIGD